MTKWNWILFTACLTFYGVIPASAGLFPPDPALCSLDLVVEVVDENGQPIPESNVTASFRHTDKQRKKLDETLKRFEKTYDGESPVHFSYESDRNVALWVEKEGYWLSGLRHKFPAEDRVDKKDGSPNGHYRKEFTIVLRKKVNPRPLYVQRIKWMTVPEYNHPFGFDLERGDWVQPNGKGVHSDFIFHVTKNELPFPEYKGSMTLTFSNKQDGIVRVEDDGIENSQLFLGTRPPNNGYVDQLEWKIGLVSVDSRHVSVTDPTYKFLESLAGSWFRVRSETTRSGEVKARYGKILGPIRFEVRDGDLPLVNFSYYFAPDHNPQVEWNGTSLVPDADLQGLKRY